MPQRHGIGHQKRAKNAAAVQRLNDIRHARQQAAHDAFDAPPRWSKKKHRA